MRHPPVFLLLLLLLVVVVVVVVVVVGGGGGGGGVLHFMSRSLSQTITNMIALLRRGVNHSVSWILQSGLI